MNNELTNEELDKLIRLAKRVLWSPPDVRKKLQDQKINIVPANFYSDIPLIEDIEGSFEYDTSNSEIYNSGLFDQELMCDFIDSISIYSSEFSPPDDGDRENPEEFFWNNPAFSHSDAMSYYCVIRHFKPNHVLEIGSGFSTLVADKAIKKNGIGKITIIEPYPKEFLRRLESVHNIIESFAQDIPVFEFVKLVECSDIWFIDSTHTVKIGSDCLYIYLKVMPEISKDIVVHSHDIYLPFGMPKKKALEKHIYWTEQYLLYAYMLDNPKVEVLFGSVYAKQIIPHALNKLMLNKYPGGGASIWYKINGKSANKALQRASR
jgi:hypothetical protein